MLLRNILLRFISPYNCYFSYIRYFLFFMYFCIIKFPIAPESIIALSVFSLILIFIYNWTVLIETTSLLAGAVSQYFFWLLLSEKSSSFSDSPRDVFFDCITDHLGGILCISYIHSGSRSYLSYKTAMVFICNLWSFVDEVYWADIIYALVPVVTFALHYRMRVIIRIIFSLEMDSPSIIATSHIT